MPANEDADITAFFQILIEIDQSPRPKNQSQSHAMQTPEDSNFEAKMSALLTEEHKRQHSENIKRGLRHKRNQKGKK